MQVDFMKCFKKHETVVVDDVSINVIGIDDLISIKHKSNRPRDLLDIQELESLKELQRSTKKLNKLLEDKIKPKRNKGFEI
jgi:hypothetical protein